MNDLAVARALHVAAILIWIGGVAMVTTVLLPAIRRLKGAAERQGFFEAMERRFAWQARAMTLLAGGTGFYMVRSVSNDLAPRPRSSGPGSASDQNDVRSPSRRVSDQGRDPHPLDARDRRAMVPGLQADQRYPQGERRRCRRIQIDRPYICARQSLG